MRSQHSFSVDLKFTTNATIHFLNSADTNIKYASSLSILCLFEELKGPKYGILHVFLG
jgi:hypothetical protein